MITKIIQLDRKIWNQPYVEHNNEINSTLCTYI